MSEKMKRKAMKNGPDTVTILCHGVSITIDNPRRMPKHVVFEKAMQRYGRQIRLSP